MSRAGVRKGLGGAIQKMYAKSIRRTRMIRLVTAAVATAITLTMAAAILPNVVAAQAAATADTQFRSRLTEQKTPEKFAAMTEAALAPLATHTLTATPIAPPAPVATRTTTRRSTSRTATNTTAPAPAGDELAEAQAILAGLIARYPILAGTTVSFGDAKGSQAIAYYKSGRIVISPTHTASLSRILNHEVWHVIDWRDNGVIDWGENIPPN